MVPGIWHDYPLCMTTRSAGGSGRGRGVVVIILTHRRNLAGGHKTGSSNAFTCNMNMNNKER